MVNPENKNHLVIIVPLYNGGFRWEQCAKALHKYAPDDVHVLVMDSGSTDGSLDIAKKYGFHVEHVATGTFNHGLTRYVSLQYVPDPELAIYLTHDAIIRNEDSIPNLLAAFKDKDVGMAYGRQLPHKDAGPIARHARLFNYPAVSTIKDASSVARMGIKAAFASDSFCAYRVSMLKEIGGFPETIGSEDMLAGVRMLNRGYKIAYVAESCVYHSHNYTLKEEFSRYFDIGVCHKKYRDILKPMGTPTGEGKRFVLSELKYLSRKNKRLVISAAIRTLAKYAGYKAGLRYTIFPLALRKKMGMYKGYWDIHKE